MSYIELLILLHVVSAIAGFGVTFSYAVLGPMAGKLGGPQGLGIMKGMVQIEKKIVKPAIVIQPLTGALLIFEAGWDNDFFGHTWLVISIVLFVAAAFIALTQQEPALEKMIELAESGKAETPEFGALAKKTQTTGPILTVMLLVIIYLMVMKPGG